MILQDIIVAYKKGFTKHKRSQSVDIMDMAAWSELGTLSTKGSWKSKTQENGIA